MCYENWKPWRNKAQSVEQSPCNTPFFFCVYHFNEGTNSKIFKRKWINELFFIVFRNITGKFYKHFLVEQNGIKYLSQSPLKKWSALEYLMFVFIAFECLWCLSMPHLMLSTGDYNVFYSHIISGKSLTLISGSNILTRK